MSFRCNSLWTSKSTQMPTSYSISYPLASIREPKRTSSELGISCSLPKCWRSISEQKNWNFTCEFISLFTFTTPTTKTPGYVLRRSWKKSKWNSKTTSILKALSSAEHQSFWLSTPFPTSRTQWSTQALQVCTLWTGSTNSSRNWNHSYTTID